MLSTVEPVVQANVPRFVSTEAVGRLGVGSKLPEFVPPQSMGNLRAGTRLPGFVWPESMGNVGAGAKLPGFGSTFRLSSSSPGIIHQKQKHLLHVDCCLWILKQCIKNKNKKRFMWMKCLS